VCCPGLVQVRTLAAESTYWSLSRALLGGYDPRQDSLQSSRQEVMKAWVSFSATKSERVRRSLKMFWSELLKPHAREESPSLGAGARAG